MLSRRKLVCSVSVAALVFVTAMPAFPGQAEARPTSRTSLHTFPNGTRAVVRWDPAQREITVRANPRALVRKSRNSAVRDVRTALKHISRATGIRFTYKGLTSKIPRGDSWQESMPAEIVISWVTPRKARYRSDKLTKANGRWVAGTGGYSYKGWGYDPYIKKDSVTGKDETAWHWKGAIGRGFVVLNADQDRVFRPGFGRGVTRGNLLLHELGHVVGLSHVNTKSSIMYPVIISRGVAGYRTGDLAGLKKVGRSQGPLNVPAWIWKQI